MCYDTLTHIYLQTYIHTFIYGPAAFDVRLFVNNHIHRTRARAQADYSDREDCLSREDF